MQSDLFHTLIHNFEVKHSSVEFWGQKPETSEGQENTPHSKQIGI